MLLPFTFQLDIINHPGLCIALIKGSMGSLGLNSAANYINKLVGWLSTSQTLGIAKSILRSLTKRWNCIKV